MGNLYNINFQSNGQFYKIHIRYNNIHDLCTMKDLVKYFTIDLAFIHNYQMEYLFSIYNSYF
jgi:hypothetical protein